MKTQKVLIALVVVSILSLSLSALCFRSSQVDKTKIMQAFKIEFDGSEDLQSIAENLDLPMEQVNQIEINSVNSNILVSSTEGRQIKIEFSGKTSEKNIQLFKHSIEDGKLKIDLVDSGMGKSFFLNWNGDNLRAGEAGPVLRVYLPKSLDKLSIDNVNGDIKIRKTQFKDIEIDQVSGAVRLDSVQSDKIEVSVISGNCRFKKIKTADAEITAVSGNVRLESDKDNNYLFQLDSVSGQVRNDIQTAKNVNGHFKITTVSGDIRIKPLSEGSSDKE